MTTSNNDPQSMSPSNLQTATHNGPHSTGTTTCGGSGTTSASVPPTATPSASYRGIPPRRKALAGLGAGRARLILGIGLLIPLLFDRLILASPTGQVDDNELLLRMATFWAICLGASCALFWRGAYRQPLWWIVAGTCAALITWAFIYFRNLGEANAIYDLLTLLVALPWLMMLHLELGAGSFSARHPGRTLGSWCLDWLIAPFSHIAALPTVCRAAIGTNIGANIGANSQGTTGKNNPTSPSSSKQTGGKATLAKVGAKVGIGLLISLPILIMLINLMAQADMVFAYGLRTLASRFNLGETLMHTSIVLILFLLVCSLISSIEDRRNGGEPFASTSDSTTVSDASANMSPQTERQPFDRTMVVTVLTLVLGVYAVFCTVQFTFLFAGAGLPDGYTYAQYAREGFFQLILVACLDLFGYGLVVSLTRRTRVINVMLVLLVASTAVILTSAAFRLGLYIAAYGLTPLRFVSMAFIVLLAVILLLCPARLWLGTMPLLTLCFVVFLVWYVVLGYMDPSGFIESYNLAHGCTVQMCTL